MGCGQSTPAESAVGSSNLSSPTEQQALMEEVKNSKRIDKMLRDEEKLMNRNLKLLLLGAGGEAVFVVRLAHTHVPKQ